MELKPTAIDQAFQKFDTPVGPVYFVERHGNTRRCFSRDRALFHLAKFMTTRTFYRSGFRQRYPNIRISPGVEQLGDLTVEYHEAHERCVRRLCLLLARKREIQKWKEKHKLIIDRFVKELNELGTRCPY
ncbi:hypothetical protein DJ252_18400 [Salmonella enterica subsp. enterica serovar Uzaramo]|nr:hypothetical protein [Salmonella enterica subsp. enterica serovar Uzaramo]EHP5748843.1 hypothetical protein [Salmonella enterica]EHP5913296.1 hypothetical protein [Salmonella enterica]EJA7722789.1 hypothetical protein [Salmonella enterica]